MKKSLLLFVGLLWLSPILLAQYSSQNQQLDAMIRQGMEDWKIPGLAAVVVKDGSVVFQKTYGVKDLETKAPVDEQTLFTMGSTTKAMIAMSVGMLVDQKQLNWEDPVRDHLPSFALSDAYITADARVKDLFTHNLGIGSGDLLWVFDSVSTEKTLERFAQVPKTYPLRGGFVYNNLMYVIAGELIEAVSGRHWTTFVEENIFQPLEMTRTQAKATGILKAGNYTTPYYDDPEEGMVNVNYNFSDQIGAAGMIWTSIEDISNYLLLLDNKGVFRGDTLLQPSTFDYLFQPHALVTQEMYPTQRLVKPHWMTYGLGWFQQDYRGHKLDFHTGSITGLIAIAGIMHDRDVAVYVLANLDHAELRHAILYKALDLYAFEDDSRDWHQEVYDLYQGMKTEAARQREKRNQNRVENTTPTLPLEKYAGTYRHSTWGYVKVSVSGEALHLNFNDYLHKETEHWHYDTFLTQKDPKSWSSFFVDFNQGADGEIKEMVVFGNLPFSKID